MVERFPSTGQPLSSHSLAIPEAVEQAHDPPTTRYILVEVDCSVSKSDSLRLQVDVAIAQWVSRINAGRNDTHDAIMTRKIQAGSYLRHDVRQI